MIRRPPRSTQSRSSAASDVYKRQDILDETVLQTTRLPQRLPPTSEKVTQARKRLNDRAAMHPINGKLWNRLAAWDLAAYRLALLELGKKNGESLSWENTSTSRLFQLLHSMTPESRTSTLKMWVSTQEQRDALMSAKTNLENAVSTNPLVPQVHLQAAFLSPLIDEDHSQHASYCRSLSSSNGNLQFANGVLAMSVGDQETMKEQWRRSLRYAPENVSNVIRLANNVPVSYTHLTLPTIYSV